MRRTTDSDTPPRDGHPVLTLRLAPAVRAQLERIARERGVTVSALVRGLVVAATDPALTGRGVRVEGVSQ